MKRIPLAAFFLLALAQGAAASDPPKLWPPQGKTESGFEYGLKGQFQYDFNQFSDDRLASGAHRFEDAHDWRRREFGGYWRKPGVFELVLGYDFAADAWIDNFLKLNAGKAHEFRLGQFKTPVGMDESATSSAGTVFLERAAPANAIYQGRRIGADWTFVPNKQWRVNLGYYTDGDLNGLNEGHTVGGRAVYTPRNEAGDVVHLGVAASREQRDDETARIRARPEAALTDVRLVDSGSLAGSDAIDRLGLEAAWQRGAWVVQSEWLQADVQRDAADGGDFDARGGYVQASWMLTGETKPYKGGAFGNPKPSRAAGAFELGLRYSTLDLDDGAIRGGDQQAWGVAANWYLTNYFKFQANYLRVDSDRRGVALSPDVFEVRAQLAF